MKLKELQEKLDDLSINPDSYSLTGSSSNECYVISNDGLGKWLVYYSERGKKTSCKTFNNETEACEELLKRLEKDPTVKMGN